MSSPQEIETRHTSGVYAKRNLTIVRGKGALVWDDRGREYVDCAAGHGVASLGHSHPKVVQAIREQAEKIITCPEMFYNPVRAALLEKLTALAPAGMERVFLSNSGTEAVEAAFKFARYSTGRTEIIAAMRGFHGRTMGALSATWNKKYRQPFQPLVPEIRHVPYNKPERLEAAVSEKTAAVILEVVQGEGGVNPGTAEFLRGAQEICRQRGALLIIDEVQTGFGRTGRMFALEHHDLHPDILCVAKALGGGVPIGATLLGERVRELHPGLHGSTFGGNPLSAAAAVAALDALVEENLPQRAAETGAYLMEALRRIESPLIREVRGLGLMIGVELKQKVAPYLTALQERGVLALNAGMNVIRLLPPLVLTQEQADRVVKAVEEVMKGEG